MRIANYIQDSIVDGPGLRLTVFTQGCPHHCPGCHNPQTHDPEGGREIAVEALEQLLLQNPLTSGLTLSGGEPFAQPEECAQLAAFAKQHGYSVWAYSGWTLEQLLADSRPGVRRLLEQLDVLVDGQYRKEERSLLLSWRGSHNQRVLDVPASLAQGTAVLWRPTPYCSF